MVVSSVTRTRHVVVIAHKSNQTCLFNFLVIRRSIVRTTGTAGDMERQREEGKRLVQVVEAGDRGVRSEILGPQDQEISQL